MKKRRMKWTTFLVVFAMITSLFANSEASMAKKVKLNVASIFTMNVGKKKDITIKNVTSKNLKSVKWTTKNKKLYLSIRFPI